MKIACTSAAFDREIASGELTQLEWLDSCAHDLRVDGVVCEIRHFPRTDPEYLAQVKKTAVDIGLAIAGVALDDAFGPAGETALEIARAIGAPLVLSLTPRATDDPTAWNALAGASTHAASAAKRANVTLAIGSRAGRLCADVNDLRRLAKDTDSAWFRYAPSLIELRVDPARDAILAKSVLLTLPLEAAPDDLAPLFAGAGWFAGYVVLQPDAPRDRTEVESAHVRAWRALAQTALETPVPR